MQMHMCLCVCYNKMSIKDVNYNKMSVYPYLQIIIIITCWYFKMEKSNQNNLNYVIKKLFSFYFLFETCLKCNIMRSCQNNVMY